MTFDPWLLKSNQLEVEPSRVVFGVILLTSKQTNKTLLRWLDVLMLSGAWQVWTTLGTSRLSERVPDVG